MEKLRLCCLVVSFSFTTFFSFAQQNKNDIGADKTADSIKKVAIDFYMKGKDAIALQQIDIYLSKRPKDTSAVIIKAICYMQLEQHKQSINYIKKFFGANKTMASKYIAEIGYVLFQKGTSPFIEMYADSALQFNPKNGLAVFLKASTFIDKEKYNEALKWATQLKKLITEDDRLRLSISYSSILFDAQKKEEGIDFVKKYIKDYPSETGMYNVLVVYYKNTKQFNNALLTLQEKMKIKTDSLDDIKQRYSLNEALGNNDAKCDDASLLYSLTQSIYYGYGCNWATKMIFLEKGDNLKYDVKMPSGNNSFSIQLFSFIPANEIGFTWQLGENTSGKLTMTKESLQNATEHKSYYSDADKNLVLSNVTSVWVSKKVFNDLINNGNTRLNISGAEKKFIRLNNIEELNEEKSNNDYYYRGEVLMKDRSWFVPFIHAKSEDKTEEIWILNNPENPLILKMKLGWEITLLSVN